MSLSNYITLNHSYIGASSNSPRPSHSPPPRPPSPREQEAAVTPDPRPGNYSLSWPACTAALATQDIVVLSTNSLHWRTHNN